MEHDATGKRSFIVSTYEKFWHCYQGFLPQHRHYYEIIQEGHPCHLYFGEPDLCTSVCCTCLVCHWSSALQLVRLIEPSDYCVLLSLQQVLGRIHLAPVLKRALCPVV